MRFEHEGIFLWYGTPEAPAPQESVQAGTGITITVGVQPMNAGNKVEVLYRINQGPTEQVTAKWLRNDTYKKSQYCRESLTALRVGDTVEYTAICRRAGRQVVPSPEEVEHFASSFHVIDAEIKITPARTLNVTIVREQSITTDPHGNGSAASLGSPVTPLPKPIPDSANNAPMLDDASNMVTHEVTGQLVNQETGAPLVGFTVHAFDLGAGSKPKDLGYQITNSIGLFAIAYTLTNETSLKQGNKNQIGRRLQLHILDLQAQDIYQTEIRIKTDQQEVGEIRVPIPKPPTLTLSELATTLRLKFPQQLLPVLAKHGISSLVDIREAGGISHIEGLPVAAAPSAVPTLEAHANLTTLSSDVQFNNALIERGYTSIDAIANASRADFISAVGERIGDVQAAKAYVAARAQTRYLDNVLAGVRADLANGFPSLGHLAQMAA